MKNFWLYWFFNLLNIADNNLQLRYFAIFFFSNLVIKSKYKAYIVLYWTGIVTRFLKKSSKTNGSRDR